jgi:hypothetical protein
MFRMLVHPSSGACDLFVALFHGLYCSGTMCVGVTLWFGWAGVVYGYWLQPPYGYHSTPAKPQRNTNTHRTRAIGIVLPLPILLNNVCSKSYRRLSDARDA